jgi:hypothetical protein
VLPLLQLLTDPALLQLQLALELGQCLLFDGQLGSGIAEPCLQAPDLGLVVPDRILGLPIATFQGLNLLCDQLLSQAPDGEVATSVLKKPIKYWLVTLGPPLSECHTSGQDQPQKSSLMSLAFIFCTTFYSHLRKIQRIIIILLSSCFQVNRKHGQ